MKNKMRKMFALIVTMAMVMSMFMPGVALAGSVVNISDSSGWFFFDDVEEGEHAVYMYYGDTMTEACFPIMAACCTSYGGCC